MKNKGFSLKNRKKAFITMVSCVALISITVIGSSIGKSWVSHSALRYNSLPDKAAVQKDIGFTPKYVESLPGGFEFEMGHIGESALVDDIDRPIVETKSLSLGYKQKDTGKRIVMSAEALPEQYSMPGEETELAETYKDCPLYYYEMMYKFVPESYELTEEDHAAFESGELEISVGSDEVTEELVQSISWNEGGIKYHIGGNDTGLSVDEFVAMAKTVIDTE